MFLLSAIKRIHRRFWGSAILLMALGFTPLAYAHNCVVSAGSFTLNADVKVDPNAATGTKIGAPITGTTTRMLTCTNTSGISSQSLSVASTGTAGTHVIYDGRIIYPTGISGIGFAFGAYSAECNNTAWGILSSGTTVNTVCKNNSGPVAKNLTYIPQIQLYKTSYATGVSTVKSLLVGYVSTNINGTMFGNNAMYFLTLNAARQTCKVTTPTVPVAMGKVPVSDFGEIAAPSSKKVPFSIGMQCSTATSLTIQIDSASYANFRMGVMNISDVANKATGVGVQLLNTDGTDFSLKTPTSIGTKNGTFAIPLYARYMQTSDKVTPGIANAAATFTVTYN